MSCRRSPAMVLLLTLGMVLGCSSDPGAPSRQTPPPPPGPTPVSTVTVTGGQGQIFVGESIQLLATLRDAAGDTLTGRAVTWTSSDNTVAALDSVGLGGVGLCRSILCKVIGVGSGAATITATADGKQGNAGIAVIQASLLSVAGDGQVGSLGRPLSNLLIVKVANPSGDGLPGVTVNWSVFDGGTVSSAAVVTDAAGLARVRWTLGLRTGAQTATVQMATARVVGGSSVTFTATTPSLVPLTDMGASTYFGFPGGLYPGGNVMPQAHTNAGRAFAAAVQPLDANGNPSTGGKYVLLSIGHSVVQQVFCFENSCPSFSFIGKALADAEVESTNLVFVKGAEGGRTTEFWDTPDRADYDRIRDAQLGPLGLSEQQVQVVWMAVENREPSPPPFPANADVLVRQFGNITRALRSRYPNLRLVFLASFSYGGYVTNLDRIKEPYAYEGGFDKKWLIQAQIDQIANGGTIVDGRAGDLNYNTVAPWIGWGPYSWADGVNPRSDGLFWPSGDFQSDGVHFTQSGIDKAAGLLLTFFKTSPQTRCWFLNTGVTC